MSPFNNKNLNNSDFISTTMFHFMVYFSPYDCSNITCSESGCYPTSSTLLAPSSVLPSATHGNEHNSSSASIEEDEKLFQQLYISCLLTICLASFNAFANGFSFFIFRSHDFEKSVMSRLLMGLSFYEVLFQLTTLVSSSLQLCRMQEKGMYFWDPNVALAMVYVNGVCRILTASFQLSRNWVVMAVSFYRYEAVCRSPSHQTIFQANRINGLLVSIGVLAFLLIFPRFFEAYEVVCASNNVVTSEKSYASEYKLMRLQANPLADTATYSYFYLSTVIFLIQTGIPVLCVFFFSAMVTQVLWKRQKFRTTCNMRPRNNSSEKLMIALAVTFFLLEMPSFFSKVLSKSRLPPLHDAYLVNISNLCIYVDSTMNIFIYLISNPTFRNASLRFLGHREVVTATAVKRVKNDEGTTVNDNKLTASTNHILLVSGINLNPSSQLDESNHSDTLLTKI